MLLNAVRVGLHHRDVGNGIIGGGGFAAVIIFLLNFECVWCTGNTLHVENPAAALHLTHSTAHCTGTARQAQFFTHGRRTSIMFLFVSDSCGSLYSVYFSRTLSMSVLAYWYSLLVLLKMIKAISQSHSTDSSYAFFMTPNLRLLNVTCWNVGERKRGEKETLAEKSFRMVLNGANASTSRN